MVWTEYGTKTRIVKANMDGTTIKEIVIDDIDTPSDIVIDQYATGICDAYYLLEAQSSHFCPH